MIILPPRIRPSKSTDPDFIQSQIDLCNDFLIAVFSCLLGLVMGVVVGFVGLVVLDFLPKEHFERGRDIVLGTMAATFLVVQTSALWMRKTWERLIGE